MRLWQLALIWFGAAISVAEVEAGMQLGGNWVALVCGHVVGGVILFAAGLIGARMGKGAMAATVSAFGHPGARFFAFLNVLQLIGWIAVMNEQTTNALAELSPVFNTPWTHLALSGIVGLWVVVGIEKTMRLSTVAMVALALLMGYLALKIGTGGVVVHAGDEAVSFWTAFEISVAMPLSWAPVISDYTCKSKRPVLHCGIAASVYSIASGWMYVMGMVLNGLGMSLPAAIVAHGLMAVGILVFIMSTVTTNLIAAHSLGESSQVISERIPFKAMVIVGVTIAAAVSISIEEKYYITFLLFIASVFAPMAAVLIASRLHARCRSVKWNFCSWMIGFAAYHIASRLGLPATPIALTISAIMTACGAWEIRKARCRILHRRGAFRPHLFQARVRGAAEIRLAAEAANLALPIMATYVVLGFGYGMFAISSGLPLVVPLVMAALIYSGSVEFLMVSLLAGCFDPVGALVMAFLVGARHLFYGVSMLERYKGAGWKKVLLVFMMSDETFAITWGKREPEGVDRHTFLLLVAILDWLAWQGGVTLGAGLGRALSVNLPESDFFMVASFSAIYTEQWLSERNHFASILGVVVGVPMVWLFGPANFMLPSMGAILVVLFAVRRCLESKGMKS